MKTDLMMRIELIVGILGLVCWVTATGQEIQPDEITTEWFTTDAPVTMMSALDVTSIRPADRETTALPPNDLRARILLNAEFEDDPTQLAASQPGVPSTAGSTLDNSLRSTNNNDWTPIVWASTRLPSTTLPQATPLPSPVFIRPPAPGPSTLVIRPTPLLRPLPTILATPGRIVTPSTERMISSSIRPSTETPTASLPPISSQPSLVHFDLEDASSGPNFTIIADPQASNDSIIIPAPANALIVNQTAQLIGQPPLADNSSSLPTTVLEDVRADDNVTVASVVTKSNNQSVQIEGESIANITKDSIPVNETTLNETVVLPVNTSLIANTTGEENSMPLSNDDFMANSSFVTQPSDNETVLVTIDEEAGQGEEILTTPIENQSSMTTDLSTGFGFDNETSSTMDFLSNSSVIDEGIPLSNSSLIEEEISLSNSSAVLPINFTNVVLLTTETPVPSTSLKAAIISVSTSVPITTTVTSEPDTFESTTAQEVDTSNGERNREESGRSTTLSALSGLATLFPALTRPPSTTSLPTEINTRPITTTTPTTTTTTSPPSTTLKTTTTSSIVFPSSGWTITPQQAPPSIPHFVNPQAGWPTTTYNPQAGWPTTTHNPHPTFHEAPNYYQPTSTEYFPDNEWPSTEGSQADDSDSTTTIVAISVSIAVILCLAIAILLLLVLRRRRARAVQGTCQPARMDAYSLDNVSQSNTWQRGKVRNSLRASKRSYCNQAFDDSTVFSVPLTAAQLALYMEKPITSIEAEFRNIATSTVRIDELPAGVETKNRYANVLPVPETRVHIRVQDNQPMDTIEQYINANYIKGPKEESHFYIACQGPMEDTVQDFWQMIWENQCKIIIQLTDLSENGVARCAEYLPPSEVLDCHRLYGDYQVTLKSRELRDNYVTSHIQLKRMEDNLVRDITHLWYSSWPATGVPEDGKTIVSLLMEARKGQSKEHKSPVVVHCSPGTGRTGAVLAIDVCMRHLDSSRSIDIPRSVHRLRQDRAGCVQTGEQYAFVYKSVNYYASQLSNAALDSL